MGVPVPGETMLILASVFAQQTHRLELPWIIVIGTLAATFGDNLGYLIGRRGGRPLLERWRRFLHIRVSHIRRGEKLIERHGPVAIFFARFIAGARVVAGPLAGILHMHWKRFALFNFLGAVTWVTAIAIVGYLFGTQWNHIAPLLKDFEYLLIAVAAAIVIIFFWRMHRRDNKSQPEASQD